MDLRRRIVDNADKLIIVFWHATTDVLIVRHNHAADFTALHFRHFVVNTSELGRRHFD